MREESFLEHSLPSSEESEQMCLGAVILDNSIAGDVVKGLSASDYYSPLNRRIHAAIEALYLSESVIDPITIGEQIKKTEGPGSLESMGGVTRITNLTLGLPHYDDVGPYIKIVRDHSIARAGIKMCNAMTRDFLAGDTDVRETLAYAESKILKLNSAALSLTTKDESGFVLVSEIAPSVEEQFNRYHEGHSTGIQTGMEPLDHVLDGGGMQGKATYLLGGIEKSGKTSLALEWASHVAIKQGKAVLIVTLEMSKETLFKRLYSMHTGIPFWMFRPGFRGEPYRKALEGLDAFSKYPFHITDNLFAMSQIRRYCEIRVEEGTREGHTEVGLIVLDYLQLVTNDLGVATNREQEVSKISRAVKMLSADLDKPVLALSSLNRVGMADGQEPDTYNLRDTGSLAFDAEAVMFVHNPAYHPGKPFVSEEVSDRILIGARQRNGPNFRINLKFIGPYMSYMTEEQYHKLSNGTRQEVPESKGTQYKEDKKLSDLWENDDYE